MKTYVAATFVLLAAACFTGSAAAANPPKTKPVDSAACASLKKYIPNQPAFDVYTQMDRWRKSYLQHKCFPPLGANGLPQKGFDGKKSDKAAAEANAQAAKEAAEAK
jgi:hypothetical protein